MALLQRSANVKPSFHGFLAQLFQLRFFFLQLSEHLRVQLLLMQRPLLFYRGFHYPGAALPEDAGNRKRGEDREHREDMVVVPVLVLHKKVERRSPDQHHGIGPAGALFPEIDAEHARKKHHDEIVKVIIVHHRVKEALPFRREAPLLIHKKDVPGGSVVVVPPQHSKFFHH